MGEQRVSTKQLTGTYTAGYTLSAAYDAMAVNLGSRVSGAQGPPSQEGGRGSIFPSPPISSTKGPSQAVGAEMQALIFPRPMEGPADTVFFSDIPA